MQTSGAKIIFPREQAINIFSSDCIT